MADPLSIAASVTGLVVFGSAVVRLLISLKQDLNDSGISSEIEGIQSGLSSLCSILGRLEGILKADSGGEFFIPHDLTGDLFRVLNECMSGFTEWSALLQKIASSSRLSKKVRWLAESKEMARLSAAMEARKSTLNITLLLIVNLSTSKILQSNTRIESTTKTTEARAQVIETMCSSTNSKTDYIKSMIERLIDSLDESSLRELSIMANDRSDASSIIMRRFLENATSYADSVIEEGMLDEKAALDGSEEIPRLDSRETTHITDPSPSNSPPSTHRTDALQSKSPAPQTSNGPWRPLHTGVSRPMFGLEVVEEVEANCKQEGPGPDGVNHVVLPHSTVDQREARQQVFTRFLRAKLDVEVLKEFGLKFQDDGPDHVLVWQSVDSEFRKRLWERTTELRHERALAAGHTLLTKTELHKELIERFALPFVEEDYAYIVKQSITLFESHDIDKNVLADFGIPYKDDGRGHFLVLHWVDPELQARLRRKTVKRRRSREAEKRRRKANTPFMAWAAGSPSKGKRRSKNGILEGFSSLWG